VRVSWRQRWAIIGLLAVMGGCDSVAPMTASATRLTVVGRLERGATVQVVVRSGADSVVGSQLTLSVIPASEATVGSDGMLTLLQAGPVTIQARLPNDSVVSGTFTVAVPPSVLFDLSVSGNRDIYEAAIDGGDLTRLTTAGGDDVHPTVAAGKVVFTSYRNGQADLYTFSLSDTTERRLTTAPDNETDPALSPDGQHLAFVRDTGGVGRVWIAAGDATGAVRLTTETAPSPEAAPAWSTDGRVVFTSTAAGSADLDVVVAANAPTAASPLVAANTAAAEVEGAWSPDAKQIAFVSTRTGPSELYVLDISTGQVTLIPGAGTNVAQPTWLPDGRIVFVDLLVSGGQLAWIDPQAPTVAHTIPLPAGDPQHPAAVR